MDMEFFWTPGGPFALRCLMTLAVKELSYRSYQLDLSRQENRTPRFLAINPLGTLPVLKDNATVVRESQAIMFYLDRAYPRVPLYGETPAEAAMVMQEICEQQSYAEPRISPLIRTLLFNRPMPAGEIAEAASHFDALLGEVDSRLASTGWLAGDRLTAADINVYPLLCSVVVGLSGDKAKALNLPHPTIEAYANLASWMERLQPFADESR